MHRFVADCIADAVHNALEASAASVTLRVEERASTIFVSVTDNGKGMDEATLNRALDPFYTEEGKHPSRRVGLGLPFIRQTAESCGGSFSIASRPGEGTCVSFSFDRTNIDAPPMGDLVQTVCSLMTFPSSADLVYEHDIEGETAGVAKSDLLDSLGTLEEVWAVSAARDFIESMENDLSSKGE